MFVSHLYSTRMLVKDDELHLIAVILFAFCYVNFTIHSFINNNIFETF